LTLKGGNCSPAKDRYVLIMDSRRENPGGYRGTGGSAPRESDLGMDKKCFCCDGEKKKPSRKEGEEQEGIDAVTRRK